MNEFSLMSWARASWHPRHLMSSHLKDLASSRRDGQNLLVRKREAVMDDTLSGLPTSLAATEQDHINLGPYRLLQKLGEGGMGEVWLAEQSRPLQRRVALKLVKAGMDSRAVIGRFDTERQALALMDHPTVARCSTPARRPRDGRYFVMEM